MQHAQKIASETRAPFRVELEPPRMLTLTEELAITRAALLRHPGSLEFRFRIANYLFILDRFDEAIDMLEALSRDGDGFRSWHLLTLALLARETNEDTRAAVRTASQAADFADTLSEKARALASLGKAQLRLSEDAAGRASLVAALDANMHDRDAYKRIAMLDFRTDRVEEALEYADAFIKKGVAHSRVLGVRPLALAKLNRIEEAREAFCFDRYLHQEILAPPAGWETIAAFNRDLAAELLAHPGIRYERYGLASANSWRIEQPCLARSKMVPLLQHLLQRAVETYVANLPGGGDAWLGARKPSAVLHHWSVITDGEGFEEWHVHQGGWLSGAYYIEVPDFIVTGEESGGCVAFGLPEGIVGEDVHERFGCRVLRPRSGLLTMFPSHAFHRTFPHRGDRRRICLAFDIAPLGHAT